MRNPTNERGAAIAFNAASFTKAAYEALKPEAPLDRLQALLRLHVELANVERADAIVRGIFTLVVFGVAYCNKK